MYAAIAAFSAGLGCSPPGAFACQSDAQCVAGAVEGICEEGGHCSFPDDHCDSGRRFGEHAPSGIAAVCVPPPPEAGSSSGPVGSEADSGETSAPGGDTLALTSGPPTDPSTTSSGGLADESSGESTGAPVDPDLVLWLAFDDPASPFLDASVYDRTIQCDADAGACPQLDAGGPSGSAAGFDGQDDVLEIQHDPALETDAGLTVALLVRNDLLSDLTIHTAIARPYGVASENSWEIFFRDQNADGDNDVVFEIADELGQTQLIVTPAAARGQWQRIVATWSGDSVALHVDGELLASDAASGMLLDDSSIYVGGDLDNELLTHHLQGAIDDVRVYRRVLSDAEIAALP